MAKAVGGGGREGRGARMGPATSFPMLSPYLTSAQRQKIEKILGVLPQKHVDAVREIGVGPMGTNIVGEHRAGRIRMATTERWGKAALIHEVGHSVRPTLSPFAMSWLNTLYINARSNSGYTERQIRQRIARGSRIKGFVTPYAATNFSEFFSESYSAYFTSPASLRRTNPEMYMFIAGTVGK